MLFLDRSKHLSVLDTARGESKSIQSIDTTGMLCPSMLLNEKGGEGGYCFDHRPPKLDLHWTLMTYYLLPTTQLPINNNGYYPPQG